MECNKIELDQFPTDIMGGCEADKKDHEPSCLRKGIAFEMGLIKNLPVCWFGYCSFLIK